jgi:hypothetical protein
MTWFSCTSTGPGGPIVEDVEDVRKADRVKEISAKEGTAKGEHIYRNERSVSGRGGLMTDAD